ncbi:hypothetical protein HAX54_044600 [Datura stramonium]|uniref:Uncharacterized protein n=1 Tax=Datura stramonium TaxID=4076 RepID=A0ABS8WGS7_DATST|nr:hypothetical protein [Datura stramonium]
MRGQLEQSSYASSTADYEQLTANDFYFTKPVRQVAFTPSTLNYCVPIWSFFTVKSSYTLQAYIGVQDRKNALDGCPGIEKEGRLKRRKAMRRYRLHEQVEGSSNRPWRTEPTYVAKYRDDLWLRGERPTKIGYSWFSAKSISRNSEYRPRSFVQTDWVLRSKVEREAMADRTLRAQVIHRSDETLKLLSSVSSGTFCRWGKVLVTRPGDIRSENADMVTKNPCRKTRSPASGRFSAFSQSTQSDSVPKEPPKGLPSDGYTKVTKLL